MPTTTLRRLSRLAFSILALASSAVGARPLAIDDVLGRPVVSDLVAAAEAPRIAWVRNDRGRRSVWTARGPAFEPTRLAAYERDDGFPVSGLALSRDGALLLFVRGSGPNAAGETANPASDPGGASQATWAVPTDGSQPPRKIVDGGGLVIGPDGTHAIYARSGEVFSVSLTPPDEAATPEPQSLFQARGSLGELTLDPSGTRIAFVSGRGDHSFVGIFDPERERVTWMAPAVDRDSAPAWSNDGQSIAFLRTPGARFGERFDITGGSRFAVWVGDPATGEAAARWTSPDDAGGFAQFYPPTALAWAGPSNLVFTSEHDGWLHAYRLSTATGPAVDLTPGPFEIESFVVSPDGRWVYVWGNHEDRNRRHVWRIPSSGGAMQRVTTGEGIEAEPHPLSDGETVAIRRADTRRPMTVSVVAAAGGAPRDIDPAAWPETFPAAELIPPQPVVFRAADGLQIHAQLFVDSRTSPPPAGRPAVVHMHGGPIRQMLLGWHPSSYYANAYAFHQILASRGFAVLSVNFRSGIGYGRGFRRAPGQGPRGASEYQDIVAAGRYLAARDDVDAKRIGLWGGSYGGLLTAMGLARDSALFAAGVDLHGVHDWAARGTEFPLPGGAWGLHDTDSGLARASSPVADVDRWRSPVLFVHGDDDRNVLFQQTTDLVQRLRARDVPVELLIFPDEVHGFLRYETWLRTFEATLEFFERRLAPAAHSASGSP